MPPAWVGEFVQAHEVAARQGALGMSAAVDELLWDARFALRLTVENANFCMVKPVPQSNRPLNRA